LDDGGQEVQEVTIDGSVVFSAFTGSEYTATTNSSGTSYGQESFGATLDIGYAHAYWTSSESGRNGDLQIDLEVNGNWENVVDDTYTGIPTNGDASYSFTNRNATAVRYRFFDNLTDITELYVATDGSRD
jgi:hypothetical protein